jgi:hypothetical protein
MIRCCSLRLGSRNRGERRLAGRFKDDDADLSGRKGELVT